MKPYVVDLSHHDKVSSFAKAKKAGLQGMIHKATQGTSMVDETFEGRIAAARKAGLLVGAYHFGTDADVDDQVSHFLDTVGDTKDILLALDYEPNPSGGTMSLKQAREWIEKVEEKTGQSVVVYSGHLIKQELDEDKDGFWGRHRLWLAQYGNNAKLPDAWDKYWIWQYTGDGIGPEPHSIDGIDGDELDLNTYDGDDISSDWVISVNHETVKEVEKMVDEPKKVVVPPVVEEEKVGPIHIAKDVSLTDAELDEVDPPKPPKAVDAALDTSYSSGFWRSVFSGMLGKIRFWRR